jgi:hypothetical protein
MIRKDHIFVANVMVIDLMREMVALSVISRPVVGAMVEFSSIAKIRKYRKLHEGHHFIPMAMEVHDTPGHDMDCMFKERAHLFHDRQSRGHLSLSFCI